MSSLVDQWKTFKTQAESGELRLDDAIGTALKTHAEQMAAKLDTLIFQAQLLDHLAGFGDLKSANDLKGKFERKASGGDGSAVERLKQSSEVLTLMAETYQKAIGKIQETDQSNASAYQQLDPGGK
ncbi:hypothetical protein [Nocardia xishanensis]